MNLYIDESGSINNHLCANMPYFVIALVHVKEKKRLQRSYKRFVMANIERLKQLDQPYISQRGKLTKEGHKMFQGERFSELKGSQFDPAMKRAFLTYFSQDPSFEVFFIKVNNRRLTDMFCSNTARCFNYTLRVALNFFISKGLLPDEECVLQLDERNEKTETRYFLENYLNTELTLGGTCNGPFRVSYFDSCENHLIQIADVFANWYYSHLFSKAYQQELVQLQKDNIIRYIFDFPL